jgi:hypothetical protein
VGIFRKQSAAKSRAQGDKKSAQAAHKLSHAPDAVSREYRGKVVTRKEYFA